MALKKVLKTGCKCTWEEIEIGEVFAWKGCWGIGIKINNEECFWLAEDQELTCDVGRNYHYYPDFEKFYKLPLSVQRLWKEE